MQGEGPDNEWENNPADNDSPANNGSEDSPAGNEWQDQESLEQQSTDPKAGVHDLTEGCQHYRRNCLIQAPCCKIFYSCKLCHDEQYMGPKTAGCKVERMSFSDVMNLKCLKCGQVQTPAEKCMNPQCQVTFGSYSCLKCKLYENSPAKLNDIFHCDECRMCRRGKKQRYFHCAPCGYCRPMTQKGNHKCTENVAESKCPVCLDVLKYSVKYYTSLKCGHLIHLQCLQGYSGINCPVCGMATQTLSKEQNKRIEEMIGATKDNLPAELKVKKVSVICNECLHKTLQASFHFYGIQCEKCGTFNTKMM